MYFLCSENAELINTKFGAVGNVCKTNTYNKFGADRMDRSASLVREIYSYCVHIIIITIITIITVCLL